MILENIDLILHVVEIIAALYIVLIGLYTYGWYKMSEVDGYDIEEPTTVSILIAARNEAGKIGHLLRDLLLQDYPNHAFEVIAVDDNSDDDTLFEMQMMARAFPQVKLHVLQAEGSGKKAALAQALKQATGELILVTDADCKVTKKWVRCIVSFYQKSHPKMILGPVLLYPATNAFNRMQTLEHMSLIGSTAGAAKINMPIMCNGANMAYQREAIVDINQKRDDSDFVSGDDVFLMEAFMKEYGADSIEFLPNKETIVTTPTVDSLSDFFHQRARWVSKSKGYSSFQIIMAELVVFAFSFSLTVLFLLGFFVPIFWLLFIAFVVLKMVIDFPILYGVTGFMKQRSLLKYTLPLEFFYPFYVVVAAFKGLFGKVFWKGRTSRK